MLKPLKVYFYKEDSGREPVLIWLKKLDKPDKKKVGDDLQTLQYGWPLGMPLVRSLGKGLWELRCKLTDHIARLLFIMHDSKIIVLHAFIKKTEKTPSREIELALERQKKYEIQKKAIYGIA
jgi:phage-related protein